MLVSLIKWLQPIVLKCMAHFIRAVTKEALPGKGGSHVARLNFKTSHVGVYKCPSLIVGFAVTVAIWQREVVSCRDLISCAVTTFWNLPWQGLCLLMTPTLCTLSSPLKLSIDKLRWRTHIDKLPKKFASGIGATYRLMLLVNLNSIIIAILSGVIILLW